MNSSKICCKCGNFSVISDKYKIGDKLICIECKSNESLALKGRIKHWILSFSWNLFDFSSFYALYSSILII